MPYENLYDVGLLDDLHNYFPRILYRPDEFNSLQDILRYVQSATRRRFNLFDRGQREYESSNASVPRNTHIRVEEQDFAPVLRAFVNLPVRGTRTAGINTLFQDVIVSASQDLIEQASRQITLEENIDDNCPICQDNMRQGELIRKLNVCGHMFHISCVDNWFLNDSVLCPSCRHDIRQPVRVSPVLRSAQAPTNVPDINENVPAEHLTTPTRNTNSSPAAPPAPLRNSLRQRSLDSQDLFNILFNNIR
jgi:hypothetical protein